MVVRQRDGELAEEAVARVGAWGYAVIAPEPCATAEDWLRCCAPTEAKP
jgi:hypothetical protein